MADRSFIKVVKFGGSSLADAEHFKKAADIILSDPTRRYVVPSAPGKCAADNRKVTDMLIRCCGLAADRADYKPLLADIKAR